MALTTYTELQAAVASWLHRTDLTSVIVDCIALAEEKFNRRLRTRHQELALADTAIDASYQIAIPSYFVAVKQLWYVDGSSKLELGAQSLEFIKPRQSAGDTARNYAIGASTFDFDGTGTVGGVLYRTIPDLATNSTNWLLTAHPSLYLYATLAEAAVHTRDADALALWEMRAESKIGEVERTAHRDTYSGPLRVRVSGGMTP